MGRDRDYSKPPFKPSDDEVTEKLVSLAMDELEKKQAPGFEVDVLAMMPSVREEQVREAIMAIRPFVIMK